MKHIHLNPNEPTTRITKAIATINKKHIEGNTNPQDKQQWQQVVDKLLEVLNQQLKTEENNKPAPKTAVMQLIEKNKFQENEVDLGNIQSLVYPKLTCFPKFNVYPQLAKKPTNKVKIEFC